MAVTKNVSKQKASYFAHLHLGKLVKTGGRTEGQHVVLLS